MTEPVVFIEGDAVDKLDFFWNYYGLTDYESPNLDGNLGLFKPFL